MSQTVKALFIVLGLVVVAIGFLAGNYLSFAKEAAYLESKLKGSKEQLLVAYTAHEQKALETAQVPQLMTAQVRELIQASVMGNQPVVQVNQQNWGLNKELEIKLVQVLESGRLDIAQHNRQMLDIRVLYEGKLESPWSGFWMRLAQYPKIDLNEFRAVTTARSAKIRDTMQEEGIIQIFGDKAPKVQAQ